MKLPLLLFVTFNFVIKSFVLIALVAILVIIVGGINGNVTWFRLGAVVFALCISGLWLTAIVKLKSAYVDMDGTTGNLDDASEAFSTAEAEAALKSKDRGTIPRQK